MSVEVAVLDLTGTITGVNPAWTDYCTVNGGDTTVCGPGMSYLRACDAAADAVSADVAVALRAVLAGEQLTAVTFTIPCDGVDDERWYDLSVLPRWGDAAQVVGATVMLWRVARPPAGLVRTRRVAVAVPEPDAAWDLIEAFPDGTLLIGEGGTITHANRQMEELSGYDRSGLLGRSVELLVPAAFGSRHRAWSQGYRAAPRLRSMGAGAQLQLRRADASELPVEISLAPVRVGDVVLTMASVRDVSAQRAAAAARSRNAERSALVARITSLVLSDVSPETVDDAVVAKTRALVQGAAGPSVPPTAGPGKGLAATPASSEVTVRVARAVGLATHDLGREVTADEADLLADLSGQLTLVLELGVARSDRQRLSRLEDRQRIARDLHDTVIQSLIGIGLQLGALGGPGAQEDRADRADAIVEDLDAVISRLRLVVFDVRGGQDCEPLAEVLEQVLATASRTLGHRPTLVVAGDLAALQPEVVDHLVPVLREALSNVTRHAAASRTAVSLTVGDDTVELLVEDDGVGPAGARAGGGTTSRRERSALLGGTSSVLPGRAGGTVLRWTASLRPHRG